MKYFVWRGMITNDRVLSNDQGIQYMVGQCKEMGKVGEKVNHNKLTLLHKKL